MAEDGSIEIYATAYSRSATAFAGSVMNSPRNWSRRLSA
jgi:hypothetical protein